VTDAAWFANEQCFALSLTRGSEEGEWRLANGIHRSPANRAKIRPGAIRWVEHH